MALHFTCGEKKNWQDIKNCQNIMTIVAGLFNSSKVCYIYLKIQKPQKKTDPQYQTPRKTRRLLFDHVYERYADHFQ